MAGFAANASQEFVGVFHGVAAFLAPAVYVTAYAVLVLGVIFLGIQLGFLLGLGLGVGLERVHGFGMGRISPGFGLALVTRTAFLAAFKRLRSRASGKYRKQCGCGYGDCYAMAHGFSFFSCEGKIIRCKVIRCYPVVISIVPVMLQVFTVIPVVAH